MKGISTKTLLEFFTDEERAKEISKLFLEVERRKEKLFVSRYTLLELVYLLEKVLHLDRDRVYNIVKTLMEDKLFKIEGLKDMERALEIYKQEKKDFLEALKEVEYSRSGVREEY